MHSGICNHPGASCCSRHAFIAEVVFVSETLQLAFDDVGLGAFRANDEDGAAVAVPEENGADPGAAAHKAGEDGLSEVDVVVIDDEGEVFRDFFAPEAREVVVVAVVEKVEAARREVGDATTDLIRGGIVAETVGTGQCSEIKDVRSERRTRRAPGRDGRAPRRNSSRGRRAAGADGRRV